jgi:hypothetical protein
MDCPLLHKLTTTFYSHSPFELAMMVQSMRISLISLMYVYPQIDECKTTLYILYLLPIFVNYFAFSPPPVSFPIYYKYPPLA